MLTIFQLGETPRQRTIARRQLAIIGLLLAALVLFPVFVTASSASDEPPIVALAEYRVYGPALDDIGKIGAWDCGANWIVGNRWGDSSADNDGLGRSLPDGYAAYITSIVPQRLYILTLYAAPDPNTGRRGGDLVIEMPYDRIQREGSYQFPTGRYDPVGKPSLFFNDGLLKFNQAIFRGGGPLTDGGRVYVGCTITPAPAG